MTPRGPRASRPWARRAIAWAGGVLLAIPTAVPDRVLAAQEPAAQVAPHAPAGATGARATVPFGPGERLEYQVKLGFMSAGEGYVGVEALDTVRGHETYRLGMGLKGGVLFAKVNDRYTSWLDTRTLTSRHFIRDVHEVKYKSFKEFAIYPEERRWEQLDEERADTMITSAPLDELAFMFWLRTLPLEVGQTYTYTNYFKKEGNPVVIRVLRRERKKVPAGEFDTIVLQPTIQTSGLFSQGGKAEIYLTDDAHRYVVYLRSEVPVVGSITMHLRRIVVGASVSASAPRPGAGIPPR